MRLDPCQVSPIGYPLLYWVVDMNPPPPIVSQFHQFSVVPLIAHSFIPVQFTFISYDTLPYQPICYTAYSHISCNPLIFLVINTILCFVPKTIEILMWRFPHFTRGL